MVMKKIELIILSYATTLILDYIFLIIVQRFDILLISGPLALIPLTAYDNTTALSNIQDDSGITAPVMLELFLESLLL